MNRSIGLICGGLAAVGFACGFAGRQWSGGEEVRVNDARTVVIGGRKAAAAADDSRIPRRKPKAVFEPSSLKSNDRLEDLVELPDGELYGRLALWMMDAGEEEIAAFWKSYEQRESKSNDINDLVFINWTRLNPHGATEAMKGSDYEHYAWWAWACHDPEAALAEAMLSRPERLNNVTWGIGEFHPEWAREHFDEIPEEARRNLLAGMAKWDDGDDPEATLDFLKQHGYGADAGTLRLLARKDPWAAYEWVRKNGAGRSNIYYRGDQDPMTAMIKTLSEEHPDMLRQLAEQTPSGQLKWEIEASLFESLVTTDPEAAIDQAKRTESSRVASERWVALGNAMLTSDPERAFEMVDELLRVSPTLASEVVIYGVDGNRRSRSTRSIEGASELVDGLLRKDPERLMGMVVGASGEGSSDSAVSTVAQHWAQRDFSGLADWLNGQEASPSRDLGVTAVTQSLNRQWRYQESLEWSMGMSDPAQADQQLRRTIFMWQQIDRDAAMQWVEQSDLPRETKEKLIKRGR